MMKRIVTTLSMLGVLLLATTIPAIEFDEVRNFEDVFVISGSAPSRDRIEVSWEIAEDYYLYNNKFLRFQSASDGVVLGKPQVPKGEIRFDDLLGEEVEKYHHQLSVTVPLLSVAPGAMAVQLKVRSQGCLESELCYPPTEQVLLVSLPQDAAAPGPLAGIVRDPLADLGQMDPVLADPAGSALQPEEAFVYEVLGLRAETALVRMTPQPGYYLYRDKFEFKVLGDQGFVIREVDLPKGVIKDDPEFGAVPVYFDQVEIPVRFNRPAGSAMDLTLEAGFQGCRDGDICYPPMQREITFQMPEARE